MDMVPMLAILIVFARLRAKVDLEGTNPPDYARKAFYGATALIYIMAFQKIVFQVTQSCVSDEAASMIIKVQKYVCCYRLSTGGCFASSCPCVPRLRR